MNNQKRKEVAKKYYDSVSRNEIISARMSNKTSGFVTLKVYNPVFKSIGTITIGIRPLYDEILLMSEIGVHGSDKLSNWLK